MLEDEVVYPNDTTRDIRRIMNHVERWRVDNPYCDQRHAAMVLSKLEEAELLSLRMVNDQEVEDAK